MLTYVDNCLCVSANLQDTMDTLGRIYDLKDTVKPPERYLGANMKEWQLLEGRTVWSSSGKDYVKNAVNICKDLLLGDGKHLKTGRNAERPMPKTLTQGEGLPPGQQKAGANDKPGRSTSPIAQLHTNINTRDQWTQSR
jgi:hypothetical protein